MAKEAKKAPKKAILTNQPIENGDLARDAITGFEGIVICTDKWLHGCTRFALQPRELKDHEIQEHKWFDEPQLELLQKAVFVGTTAVAPVPPPPPGGPRPDPTRRLSSVVRGKQ